MVSQTVHSKTGVYGRVGGGGGRGCERRGKALQWSREKNQQVSRDALSWPQMNWIFRKQDNCWSFTEINSSDDTVEKCDCIPEIL